MKAHCSILAGIALALTAQTVSAADGPTVSIQTEYIATMDVALDAPQPVGTRLIFNVPPGGTLRGPQIEGTSIAPTGDWLTVLPDGTFRLDVRASFKTDDGVVFVEYNGIIAPSKEVMDRFGKGETITDKDEYFITAPRFTTSSKKYAWLNKIQAVGKMVTLKQNRIKYDLFAVR